MAGITFEISPAPCGGGGHFEVITTAAGRTLSRTYHKSELLIAPTKEELGEFADVLIRLLVSRLNTGDHAECRDRIHGLEVTVQPRNAS
jgi:hypothetical protein